MPLDAADVQLKLERLSQGGLPGGLHCRGRTNAWQTHLTHAHADCLDQSSQTLNGLCPVRVGNDGSMPGPFSGLLRLPVRSSRVDAALLGCCHNEPMGVLMSDGRAALTSTGVISSLAAPSANDPVAATGTTTTLWMATGF